MGQSSAGKKSGAATFDRSPALGGGAAQDTFDVFFSYHWNDHAAVERIARALIDRGVRVFLDRWYVETPGQSWLQALETALGRCRAVAVFLGPEGLGPWQQREKDLALDRQGREPGFPVIPVLLARSDPGLGFLKLNTWVDFSSEGLADPHTIEVLIAAIRGETARIESARATICPYRGLRPFREEDEPFFFGRATFTETLATTLARQSFVAVVGASGSGKSSVVRAGLIPRLRRGEDGRIWEAVSFVPSDRPLVSLAASLLPLLEPDLTEIDRLAEVGKLARHLAEGEVRLRDVISRILAKQPGTERLLLFADQWEELYTLCTDDTIRTVFVAQLLEVVRSAAVTVVLTLRGDFMGHALADRELSDRLQDSIVIIGPMTRNELAETITKPAKKTNLTFEAGLVETILDDVGDEPGNLPLLEFLLETLWKQRRGALLHYAAYQQLGRVAGAIAHHADAAFDRLTKAERQAAQRLLMRMIGPDGYTRLRAAMPKADPVAEATIRKLADARLVVTERDAASGRETVEVAHDALIRGWARLRLWVDQGRKFLRTQIDVQMVKGSGMLVGQPSELILRVTNHTESVLEKLVVEIIQPSAEYQVVSTNPLSTASFLSGQTIDIGFLLMAKVSKQIAVNYRVNGELKEPPLYITAIRDNPYVYGDPVKDGFSFFGRTEELEQIVQAITKPTKQDILVVGERRTGKTSLIYQVITRLEKPFIPVYVVLNTCEPNTERILDLILRKIVHRQIEEDLLTPDWAQHNFRYFDFEDNIREIIDAVKVTLADAKIVLLLDEADYLLKVKTTSRIGDDARIISLIRTWLSADILEERKDIDELPQNILRAALQSARTGDALRAVIAGTSDLSTYMSQRSSPFFNHFRFVPLKPFASDEIRELITKPASILRYSYSSGAVERIMSLSGGQPFYCQAFCYEAFGNALRANRYLISDQDVEIAERKRVTDQFSSFLSYFWSRTDKAEKRFLSALVYGDDTSEFTHAQIRRLVEWGLIVQRDGLYAFAGGLVAKWTEMASGKS